MNTNALARNYDKLTPAERLPLLVAAHRRGDHQEFQRLADSAPARFLEVPDYYLLAKCLSVLATAHLLQTLDLAIIYQRLEAIELDAKLGAELCAEDKQLGAELCAEEKQRAKKFRDCATLVAYRFTIEAQAWEKFCGERKLDADAPIQDLPGFSNFALMRDRIPKVTREEVLALFPDLLHLGTADEILNGMRGFWAVETNAPEQVESQAA